VQGQEEEEPSSVVKGGKGKSNKPKKKLDIKIAYIIFTKVNVVEKKLI